VITVTTATVITKDVASMIPTALKGSMMTKSNTGGRANKEYRERIKRFLWERNFVREAEKALVENMVSATNRKEYLGENFLEPAYLRIMVKLFCAMLLNKFFDETINGVLDVIEELGAEKHRREGEESKDER
jgi:hypothetical protein